MFSSALKSFSSNISSNYSISSEPTCIAGPWKIYDAKKKSTGNAASVFVFERKTLEPKSSFGRSSSRAEAQSLKRAQDEVVDRLKKEAASLARLRHPSILELVEPAEDTRSGGLQFATEQVTASLAGLLQEKDEQERGGGVGGRSSRYVVEETEGGGRRRREVEIDELEIQKGLLQVGKGLEFLHESAGLVHGNLSPDSIYVNAKGDWKISGLGFCSPPPESNIPTSVAPVSLDDILTYDPRLPRMVQLNVDYTSPDFVLDSNLNTFADMFSLGVLIIALYNSPHVSSLQTNQSISSYKKLFSSPSSMPSGANNYLVSGTLPRPLLQHLLPRLITRRPAERLSAREFQQSPYFDNILVSTIRFLDSLPAKAPNEKAQFMRGFPRILNQFPKSVLEKKVLSAFIEEMKDKDLLALVLTNIFKIIAVIPSGRRVFSEKVIPRLREIFLTGNAPPAKANQQPARDLGKEAGLMIILENLETISDSCSAKDFKDNILPIVHLAIESSTPSLVDASLRKLPTILPMLDFSTVKNDLFPVIANVFSKTTSLGIKVRGLEAFAVLCGSTDGFGDDGLDGKSKSSKPTASSGLDKFTVQEKIVPLMKAIKTKEPAVMMAALRVFSHIGKIADSDFLATEVLPIVWSMALGPLLNLKQFQGFMSEIKAMSSRVEQEQTKKLQEMSTSTGGTNTSELMAFGRVASPNSAAGMDGDGTEEDFEKLVFGNKGSGPSKANNSFLDSSTGGSDNVWMSNTPKDDSTPSFSWSSPRSQTPNQPSIGGAQSSLTSIAALQPSAGSTFAAPITPSNNSFQSSTPSFAALTPQPISNSSSVWSNPSTPGTGGSGPNYNAWRDLGSSSQPSFGSTSLNSGFSSMSLSQPQQTSAQSQFSSFSIPPPPANSSNLNAFGRPQQTTQGFTNPQPLQPQSNQGQSQKKGLDAYESLL